MIDLIGTLRRLTASILGIATDTTTIAADVAGLDGDAMRGTDDATLQATWTDALATALTSYTAARAVYLDELAAANIPSDVDNLLSDTAILEHKWESRTRVYPQDTQVAPQITTAAVADTFGNWTMVIPIDTVDFDYRVTGIEFEQTNRAGTFLIQFGYSTVDGDDPTTAQIAGERRVKFVGTPLKLEQSSKNLLGGHIHANSKLWARLKSDTGTADMLDISVIVTRCLQTSNPVATVETWPWAS